METPTILNTKIANLILNGKRTSITGSFPQVKKTEREYRMSGYRTHVGYALFYNGVSYCKKCSDMVVKPYIQSNNGHGYYQCAKCETINYVS